MFDALAASLFDNYDVDFLNIDSATDEELGFDYDPNFDSYEYRQTLFDSDDYVYCV